MGFLDSLKTYGAGSWTVRSTKDFTDAEKASIESAVVIDNNYGGLNVMFTLKNGLKKYANLSTKSSLGEGEMIDVNSLKLIELQRDQEICCKVDGVAL